MGTFINITNRYFRYITLLLSVVAKMPKSQELQMFTKEVASPLDETSSTDDVVSRKDTSQPTIEGAIPEDEPVVARYSQTNYGAKDKVLSLDTPTDTILSAMQKQVDDAALLRRASMMRRSRRMSQRKRMASTKGLTDFDAIFDKYVSSCSVVQPWFALEKRVLLCKVVM